MLLICHQYFKGLSHEFNFKNRADRKKTKIIGALCGLGTERYSSNPAFADHDMEIIFDTKIDVEDIYRVN